MFDMIYYKTKMGGEKVRLTFPYIFKANRSQKEILEEIKKINGNDIL